MMPIRLRNLCALMVGLTALIACITEIEEAYQGNQSPQTHGMAAAQKKAVEQPKNPPSPPDKVALLRQQEAAVLRSAYMLLASANNKYDGHKGKAMGSVQAALKLLDPNSLMPLQTYAKATQEQNTRIAAKVFAGVQGSADVMQAISDAQVANAGVILTNLATVMAANKQQNPLVHVQNAVKEINAAPKHDTAAAAIKGNEADVLTSAYILLASANHDYDGHRVKAMKKIEDAVNILDANLLKNGTVAQKTKAIQDANAISQAKSTDGDTNELQAISDHQLLMASTMVQRVGSNLNPSTQKSVLNLLQNANNEIGIALKIR